MRDYTDIQQICLNGHQVNIGYSLFPAKNRNHCPKCGEKTIIDCPKCTAPIPGGEFTLVFGLSGQEEPLGCRNPGIPGFCDSCGAPFPWVKFKGEVTNVEKHAGSADSLILIERMLRKFPLMVMQLGNRYSSRPTIPVDDEYDVQDLIHSLLHLFFDNIKPEEYTPSYGGSSSRIDFLIEDNSIAIEIKKTRDKLGNKELTTELNDDIARYRKHPSCKTLFCFVYDPAYKIKNPIGMEKDLSGNRDGLEVKVIIVPRGL